MNVTSLFTSQNLNSEHIDYHTYQFIQAHNLVYPRYNKITLSELDNTFHEQACLFWSRMVKSFHFENEKKAEKIKIFLTGNVIDLFERKVGFLRHVQSQLYNWAKYRAFQDSLIYTSKGSVATPVWLTNVNTKYLYWDKKMLKAWAIVPNSGMQQGDKVGSEDSNRDYQVDSFEFVRLGIDRATQKQIIGSDQRILEFAGLGSCSDFYSNIPYLESMGGMRVNKKIGDYDESWLENGSVFRNIMVLNGLNPSNPLDKDLIDEYKQKYNNAATRGAVEVLANPRPNLKDAIEFKTLQPVQKENFNEDKDSNRDLILAANGLNPTLLGIKTNESSLTSTSQAEAIKLFKVTQLDNLISSLEEHLNILFSFIDPNYDTKIILETIKFEDDLKLAQTEAAELANEANLIGLGIIEDYNAYRVKKKKKEVTPQQWQILTKNYLNAGMNFEDDSVK